MNDNKSISIQDIELFMMAQFIDVIDEFGKYETIEEIRKDIEVRKKTYLDYIKQIQTPMKCVPLNLYDESIDNKLERSKEAYSDSTEYKITIQKLKVATKQLDEKIDKNTKEYIEQINDLLYQIYNFKTHLAYKFRIN